MLIGDRITLFTELFYDETVFERIRDVFMYFTERSPYVSNKFNTYLYVNHAGFSKGGIYIEYGTSDLSKELTSKFTGARFGIYERYYQQPNKYRGSIPQELICSENYKELIDKRFRKR